MLEKPKQQMSNRRPNLGIGRCPQGPTSCSLLQGCQIDTRKAILIECRMWPKDQKSIIYIRFISIKEPTRESIGPGQVLNNYVLIDHLPQ